jgi:hypothetical protein
MVTCAVCKFWQLHDLGWGACNKCEDRGGRDPSPDCRFYSWAYERFSSELTTRHDFGCIEGEPQP